MLLYSSVVVFLLLTTLVVVHVHKMLFCCSCVMNNVDAWLSTQCEAYKQQAIRICEMVDLLSAQGDLSYYQYVDSGKLFFKITVANTKQREGLTSHINKTFHQQLSPNIVIFIDVD